MTVCCLLVQHTLEMCFTATIVVSLVAVAIITQCVCHEDVLIAHQREGHVGGV